MFDLEYKITWDELAPSLQAMFKTVQNQVNQAIQDITNIKNDIYNKVEDVKDDMEDLRQDMNSYDFLNLAPKIGYFQDDTLQIVSKYNMNYMASDSIVLTTESNKQEVMYFIANDGGPDSTNDIKLYRAYRTDDNQAFSFDNEPLVPKYFSSIGANGNTTKITGFLGGDNNYIVACIQINGTGISQWHLINTGYSSNPTLWDSYKNITSIVQYGGSCYQIKYLQEYGTIIGIYLASTDRHYVNPIKFRVFRYSDLSLIKEYSLENPFTLIQLNENYSFNNTKKVNNAWDKDNICTMNTISGWCRAGFIYYEQQELLVFTCYSMHSSWYNWDKEKGVGTSLSDSYNLPVKMVWKVPLSISQGKTTDKITLINQLGDWTIHGTFTNWASNCSNNLISSSNQFHKYTSYDTINGRSYLGGKYRDQGLMVRCVRFNNDEQIFKEDDPTRREYQGTVGGYYFGTYLELPDASLWGKQVWMSPGYWDHIIVNGYSKQGVSYLWVRQWKYVNGYEKNNYIEPVPGEYQSTSKPDLFGQVYDCSCKCTDGSARYFRTTYNASYGGIRVIEFLHEVDENEQVTYKFKDYKVIPFKLENSQIYNRLGKNISFRCAGYNPTGDYAIILYQNNLTDPDKATYAHKLYFSIVLANGTEYFFGPDFDTKLDQCAFGSRNNTIYGWLPTNVGSINPVALMFLSKTRVCWNHGYYVRDSNYGSNYVCIDFTDNLKDIKSCKNIGSGTIYSYTNYQKASHIYLGPKLGILCMGNGWVYRPQRWILQKPLLGSDNAKYPTEDEFLANPLGNGNAYYMYLQSSQGLVCYVPSIPIFLGGYFSIIEQPIEVQLYPNCTNYVYLERDPDNRDNVLATVFKYMLSSEGNREFSRILCASIVTDDSKPISTKYYRINIGYNDYLFNN